MRRTFFFLIATVFLLIGNQIILRADETADVVHLKKVLSLAA